MGENKKRINGDLLQILLNVVIIGIFSIIEKWFLFSYGSWGLAAIFGILMMLMCCLLTINIYSCFTGNAFGKKKENKGEEKQVQALLYKQMKRLEAEIPTIIIESEKKELKNVQESLNKQMEELKINQLRFAKVVLNKMEQIEHKQEELETLLDQAIQTGLAVEAQKIQQTEEENVAITTEPIEEPVPEVSTEKPENNLMDALQGSDPNRELSPDEIAALFAGANN